jgi:phage terminase small subunit
MKFNLECDFMTEKNENNYEIPKTLSIPAQQWIKEVMDSFELEPHHREILIMAGQQWDRAAKARKVLEKEGLTQKNRFGEVKQRPEVSIERGATITFSRLIRELRLDVEPPNDSRPDRLAR